MVRKPCTGCVVIEPPREFRRLIGFNWLRVSLESKRDVNKRCSVGVQERFESGEKGDSYAILSIACQDYRFRDMQIPVGGSHGIDALMIPVDQDCYRERSIWWGGARRSPQRGVLSGAG
jgi:hypothetical protein